MMTSAGHESAGKGRKGRIPFLRLLGRLIDLLEASGKIVAVLCLAFMFVALFANVVLRYAFGSGIAWAYEIHALLLPWLVAGGIVIAAARGRNIAVTLLAEMLQGRARILLCLVIQIVIFAISVGVLWSGQPILRAAQFQTLSTLGIKQIWGYTGLVYAFAAMALIALFDALRYLAGVDAMSHDPARSSLS
ncbi:TRAP transporter small permease [Chelativorans salis]|uniref:TRAP transporter small permease protein n=1 Tax=Chelativorans salis TaxID=2978478 RepID=A0ABT2LJ58_9HYPH|nr:TRAP transporter small permease subunit [Chelativorans sp. EGI FJ00035]MCT7374580.1 TRAP transporter small permease subunit [Chelativorans sp. EGI FJ00035]